jgi:hypothetical protein
MSISISSVSADFADSCVGSIQDFVHSFVVAALDFRASPRAKHKAQAREVAKEPPTEPRGFGWRIHCGVEVTVSSTNKQHTHKRCLI